MSKKARIQWNAVAHRITVAAELAVKVKTNRGKTVYKTRGVNGPNPVWDEMFFLDEAVSSLTFVVVSGKSKHGSASLDKISHLHNEQLHSLQLDLRASKSKEVASGHLIVRVIVSSMPDQVALLRGPEMGYHFHRLLLDQIKTGDLIAYSDRGALADFIKLRSGAEFTHLGIVLKVPNPATAFVETFVIEVTSNREGLIDAWHENPVNGITIFRLDERLCQYYGNAAWLVPLQKEISYRQEKALLKFTHTLHLRRSHQYVVPSPLPSLSAQQLAYLKDFGSVPKSIRSMTELWSPIFTYQALHAAKIIKHTLSTEVMSFDAYQQPYLLFCAESHFEVYKKDLLPNCPIEKIEKGRVNPVFAVSEHFDKPFPFSQIVGQQRSIRTRKVADYRREEEEELKRLAEKGDDSGEELFDDDALSSSEVQFNEGDMVDEEDSELTSSSADPRARSASASSESASFAPPMLQPPQPQAPFMQPPQSYVGPVTHSNSGNLLTPHSSGSKTLTRKEGRKSMEVLKK